MIRKLIIKGDRREVKSCICPAPHLHIQYKALIEWYFIQRAISKINRIARLQITAAIGLGDKWVICKFFRPAPGVSIVIFCSCTKVGRETLAIYIYLLVALSPPGVGTVKESKSIANIDAFTL
jgi:hypothetical protein